MATYTVAGHPLGSPDVDGIDPEVLRAALQLVGVGSTVTITLSGADDTQVKDQAVLR